MAHTPGPWVEFSDGEPTVALLPAMRVGKVCTFAEPYPSRDDAALMRAAPDLLAFVREIALRLRGDEQSERGAWIRSARELLAKVDAPR